ncbi:MAG: tyrosine-type recombinase/integrase [Candidatus Odinarchaeota archaeon]
MSNRRLKYPISDNKKIPYYKAFIKRYSESTREKVRNKLIFFALYLQNQKRKSILEAGFEDCIDFLEQIDNRDISRVAKSKWRSNLNAYYEYVVEIKKKKEKIDFINPVPSINLFDFKDKEISIEEIEKEEDLMTYSIVEKILNYLFFTRKRLFIIVSILLYTGARISEVCRIEMNNTDPEERYFITKVKSKKSINRMGIYFLPSFFIPYLKEWIEIVKIENSNTIYLFPSGDSFITPKTIRKKLRSVKNELGLTCKMNPHAFRDLINSERFDTKMKTKYRFLLLNQTPPNVNVKNYLKKYKLRRELQKKYDEFFPFPKFKPKLNLLNY